MIVFVFIIFVIAGQTHLHIQGGQTTGNDDVGDDDDDDGDDYGDYGGYGADWGYEVDDDNKVDQSTRQQSNGGGREVLRSKKG